MPPVCKLLNYGKYKFEQEKKIKDSRKKVKGGELKEIRMQPRSPPTILTSRPST